MDATHDLRQLDCRHPLNYYNIIRFQLSHKAENVSSFISVTPFEIQKCCHCIHSFSLMMRLCSRVWSWRKIHGFGEAIIGTISVLSLWLSVLWKFGRRSRRPLLFAPGTRVPWCRTNDLSTQIWKYYHLKLLPQSLVNKTWMWDKIQHVCLNKNTSFPTTHGCGCSQLTILMPCI